MPQAEVGSRHGRHLNVVVTSRDETFPGHAVIEFSLSIHLADADTVFLGRLAGRGRFGGSRFKDGGRRGGRGGYHRRWSCNTGSGGRLGWFGWEARGVP